MEQPFERNRMKRRKIFFVSNTVWNLVNFRISLMEYLKFQGMEVYAVAPFSGSELPEEIKSKFPFIPIKYLDRKSKSVFRDFKLLAEFIQIYMKYKPNLVLHFTIKPNIYGSIACGLLGIPSIVNVTGLGYIFTEENVLRPLVKMLYKLSFIFSKRVIFQNRSDYEYFKDVVPVEKAVIIPGSGVNVDRYSPEFCEKLRKFNPFKGGRLIILMISRLLWHKGIREFVEAAGIVKRKNPNVEFWLLGPIDEGNPATVPRHVLFEWQKKGLIKYLGATDDVRPFICKSDVVVLPSYREGLPKALLEAMSMAKPIVTTNVPGCKETVIDGYNGFLVEPRNAKALSIAIEKFLLLSREERRKFGLRGRDLVMRNFSDRVVLNLYSQVISQVFALS